MRHLVRWAALGLGALGWLSSTADAQSIETLGGTAGAFADVQFLSRVVPSVPATVFSRTRVDIPHGGDSNLFSGLYLSYTSTLGLGPTIVGRAQGTEVGADAGFHFFYVTSELSVFALLALEVESRLGGSLFAISRYRRPLTETLKLFSSFEVFSLWRREQRHVVTVERLRLGLELDGWAGGLGLNASHAGDDWNPTYNPGLFVRRDF